RRLHTSPRLRATPDTLLSLSSGHVHHPALHSFPTRRSSDLSARRRAAGSSATRTRVAPGPWPRAAGSSTVARVRPIGSAGRWTRSEEHTSELQSRVDLVCRLLLEKKNENFTNLSVISDPNWK